MDAFFESCALRANDLPKAKQGWLQMQVSTLLYTAENSHNLPPPGSMMWSQPDNPPVQSYGFPTQVPLQGNTFPSAPMPNNVLPTQAPFQGNAFHSATMQNTQAPMQNNAFQPQTLVQGHSFPTQGPVHDLPTQMPVHSDNSKNNNSSGSNNNNDMDTPVVDILGMAMTTLQ